MATFEYATPIFKLNGAQIYLLHVLDENGLGRKSKSVKCLNQNSRDATNYALKQLNILENRYLSKCGEIKKVIRCGEPYKEIVRFANENKIDLILISTHGRTGILRALMGSVAEKVGRYASVPVLTVKPDKVQIKLMEQEDIDEQLHLKPNIKK